MLVPREEGPVFNEQLTGSEKTEKKDHKGTIVDFLNSFLIDCLMQNSTFMPSTKDHFRVNY
jgi:hypothetical protein